MGTHQSDVGDMIEQDKAFERDHGRYYDTSKVQLTKGDPARDLWLQGRITSAPAYRFEAKVFDAGSEYGIDNGRISKLYLYKGDKEVAFYDNFWVDKPKTFDFGTKYALAEVKAAFSRTVEQVNDSALHGTKADRPEAKPPAPARVVAPAPYPAEDQRAARPVNPMGFFKKSEAAPAPEPKDWTLTAPTPEASPAPEGKDWTQSAPRPIHRAAMTHDQSNDDEHDR